MSYPDGNLKVPWAKLGSETASFCDEESFPPNIVIQDPSRMQEADVETCLRRWKDAQEMEQAPIRFHHVWSGGKFVAAELGDVEDKDDALTKASEDEDQPEEFSKSSRSKHGHMKGSGRATKKRDARPKKSRKGKDKATGSNSPTGEASEEDEGTQTGRYLQAGMKTKHDRNVKSGRQIGTKAGGSGKAGDPKGNGSAAGKEVGAVGGNWKRASGSLPAAEERVQIPGVNHVHFDLASIDPLLAPGYPTGGPNDTVPHGYQAVPRGWVKEMEVPVPQDLHLGPDSQLVARENVQLEHEILLMKRRKLEMELAVLKGELNDSGTMDATVVDPGPSPTRVRTPVATKPMTRSETR